MVDACSGIGRVAAAAVANPGAFGASTDLTNEGLRRAAQSVADAAKKVMDSVSGTLRSNKDSQQAGASAGNWALLEGKVRRCGGRALGGGGVGLAAAW